MLMKLVFSFMLCDVVNGHGFLFEPNSRQRQASNGFGEDCASAEIKFIFRYSAT